MFNLRGMLASKYDAVIVAIDINQKSILILITGNRIPTKEFH